MAYLLQYESSIYPNQSSAERGAPDDCLQLSGQKSPHSVYSGCWEEIQGFIDETFHEENIYIVCNAWRPKSTLF
jgi:hypothetical protein